MREEFEKWAANEAEIRGCGETIGLMRDEHRDRYAMIWTQTAWIAWQASRQALVIELPKQIENAYSESECAEAEGWNDCLDRCATAIARAGVKVKP